MFEFISPSKPSWFFEVHLFTGSYNNETIVESEEMKPQWFSTHSIPFDSMWEDDKYWLPCITNGGSVLAHYIFDDDSQRMLNGLSETILPSSPENRSGLNTLSTPNIPASFPTDFRKWIAQGGFNQS